MSDADLHKLQQEIKAKLDRDLPLEVITANQARLERMLAAVDAIETAEDKLGLIEPASIGQLLRPRAS